MGLRLPPSVTQTGVRPRRFVSLLDLYPTLTRLANVPLDDVTADLLDGTDLFEIDPVESNESINPTTDLAKMLVRSGVGDASSFRQAVYPIVEHKYAECLVMEELHYIRNMNASVVPEIAHSDNPFLGPEWRSPEYIHDLYLLPERSDDPRNCAVTEGLHGNIIHQESFKGEVVQELGRYIDVQRSSKRAGHLADYGREKRREKKRRRETKRYD